jgi:hypothetical protein
MSTEEHKQLISGLVDEVWNQHHAAAIDRYFGPDLREESPSTTSSCSAASPTSRSRSRTI